MPLTKGTALQIKEGAYGKNYRINVEDTTGYMQNMPQVPVINSYNISYNFARCALANNDNQTVYINNHPYKVRKYLSIQSMDSSFFEYKNAAETHYSIKPHPVVKNKNAQGWVYNSRCLTQLYSQDQNEPLLSNNEEYQKVIVHDGLLSPAENIQRLREKLGNIQRYNNQNFCLINSSIHPQEMNNLPDLLKENEAVYILYNGQIFYQQKNKPNFKLFDTKNTHFELFKSQFPQINEKKTRHRHELSSFIQLPEEQNKPNQDNFIGTSYVIDPQSKEILITEHILLNETEHDNLFKQLNEIEKPTIGHMIQIDPKIEKSVKKFLEKDNNDLKKIQQLVTKNSHSFSERPKNNSTNNNLSYVINSSIEEINKIKDKAKFNPQMILDTPGTIIEWKDTQSYALGKKRMDILLSKNLSDAYFNLGQSSESSKIDSTFKICNQAINIKMETAIAQISIEALLNKINSYGAFNPKAIFEDVTYYIALKKKKDGSFPDDGMKNILNNNYIKQAYTDAGALKTIDEFLKEIAESSKKYNQQTQNSAIHRREHTRLENAAYLLKEVLSFISLKDTANLSLSKNELDIIWNNAEIKTAFSILQKNLLSLPYENQKVINNFQKVFNQNILAIQNNNLTEQQRIQKQQQASQKAAEAINEIKAIVETTNSKTILIGINGQQNQLLDNIENTTRQAKASIENILQNTGLKDTFSIAIDTAAQNAREVINNEAMKQTRKFEKAIEKIQTTFESQLSNLKIKLEEKGTSKKDIDILCNGLREAKVRLFNNLKIDSNAETVQTSLNEFVKECQGHISKADSAMDHGWLYKFARGVIALFAGIGMIVGAIFLQGVAKKEHRQTYGNTFFSKTESSQTAMNFKNEVTEFKQKVEKDEDLYKPGKSS